MVAQFKTGSRVVPLSPAPISNANMKCSSVFLKAHVDNTNNIHIGPSDQLAAIVPEAIATATINTGDGELVLTASNGGTSYNDRSISFALDANTAANAPNVVENSTGLVITVNSTVNTDLADLNTVLLALTNWDSNVTNAGNFNPGDAGVTATTANGVDEVASEVALSFANGDLTVTATEAGTAWDSKSVVFALDANTAANAPVAAYANDTITITVNSTVNTDLADINTTVNSLANWASVANAGEFSPGDAGITATTSNGVNGVTANGTLTVNDGGAVLITSANTGAAWNGKSIVFALDANTPEATPTAAYANDVLTITVNSGANTTTANIVTAVNTTAEWVATEANAGSFEPGVDDTVNTTTANGVTEAFSAATITLGDAGEFTVTSILSGTAWDSKSIVFVLDSGTDVNTPNAVYANNVITITVNSTNSTNTAVIVAAVHGLDDWNCAEDTGGNFDPGDAGLTGTTSNGVNAVAANALVTLASGSITITAEETGTAWNSKTIAFSLGSVLVNAPNAVYASNAITITANSTANTTTANLTTALDGLANWSAVETAPGVFAPMDAGIVETTSGGDGGTFLGYIMSNNVEVELPVEALNEIYVYTDVDDQILSWVAKGV